MKRQKTLHDFWSPKNKPTKTDAKGRSDGQKSPTNQQVCYGNMQRYSLERAAAITLTQTLVDRLKDLDITKEHDRVRLREALVRIAWPGTSGFCCLFSRMLQKELHKVLLCNLMSEDLIPKAPVFLTIMLALCWDVKIKVACKDQPGSSYDGMSRETCCGILKVIEEFQEHWATAGGGEGRVELEKEDDGAELEKGGACVDGEDEKGARKQIPLPTKSLVFGYDKFQDETFLPRLVEKMSNLQSVSLSYSYGDTLKQALAQHCTKLQKIKMSNRKDVLSFLFGVPQNLIKCNITENYSEGDENKECNLIDEFCEGGEDLHQKFVPQFPNLRILTVSRLKSQVYILIHLLHPKMVFTFPSSLSKPENVADYRRMWKAVHGPNSDLSVLPITHALLSEDLCKAMTQPESGQDLVKLFNNISFLDISEIEIESDDDRKLVKDTIYLFPKTQVTILFLEFYFDINLTLYGHLEHLKLRKIYQTELYTLLDSLPKLCTLSVIEVYVSRKIKEDDYKGQTHTRLTTLSIHTLWLDTYNFRGSRGGERPLLEIGLFFILRCLPNLRSLCLCQGNSDQGSSRLIMQGAFLCADLFNTPILTHLEEVCCLEFGVYMNVFLYEKEFVYHIVLNLVQNLPALCHLVLSSSHVETYLTQILEYLQKSHVELKFGCKAEEVFGVLESHL